MSPTLTIVLLWLAFAASHMLLSSLTLRPRIIGVLGEKAFAGVYSLIALATFVPMVSVYFGNKHTGTMFWALRMTPPLEALVTVVMGIAVILLVAGMVTPSPVSMTVAPGQAVEIKGVHYITRHGVFMAAGLFGLVHLIPNGFASDIAFFAGFPIFAVIGCLHQDQRKLVTDSESYVEFHAATPLIPFTGKQSLRGLRELAPIAYVVGIGLAFTLRYFHANWFGGG
jgi:uncharacterized membrane protein